MTTYDNLLTYVRPGAEAADKYTMTYGDTEEEKKKAPCAHVRHAHGHEDVLHLRRPTAMPLPR